MKIEEKKLDEVLPKSLAKEYRKGTFTHPDSKRFNTIDIQNSSADELTPDQALELIKTDPHAVRAIVKDSRGNPRVVTFNERGKVDTNNNIELLWGDNRIYTTKKGEGESKNKLSKMPAKYVLSLADKIYKVSETEKDAGLLKSRRENPESPNYAGADSYDVGKVKGDIRRVKNTPKYLQYNFNAVGDVDADGNISVKGSYGGFGNADYWKNKYIEFKNRWGFGDSDTKTAYAAWRIASGEDRNAIPNPEYTTPDRLQNRLKYWDVEKILQAPKEKLKQGLSSLNSLENKKSNRIMNRDSYSSPEARAEREGNIKRYISRYKGYILDYLRDLEKYESQLDDLDERDLEQIKKYNDEIDALTKQIDDIKKGVLDPSTLVRGAFGAPVPESLQEGHSLDELVDQKEQSDDTDEDIISKYTR